MKLSFNQKWLLTPILMLFGAYSTSLNAEFSPKCNLAPDGSAVAVWNTFDPNGNTVIQSAQMSSSGIWSNPYTISYDVGNTIAVNSEPLLYSNSNGDVVAVWQYFDAKCCGMIAASMLPFGATDWNTHVISSNLEDSRLENHRLDINESGNVLLLWSSTNRADRSIKKIWSSTSSIGTLSTWTNQINIVP